MFTFKRKTAEKLSFVLVLLLITSFLIPAGCVHASLSLKNSAIQFLEDDFRDDGMVNGDTGVGSYALYVLTGAGVDVSDWEYNGDTLHDYLNNNALNDDGSFGTGKNVLDAITFLYAYNLVVEEEDELYIDPERLGFRKSE